MKRKAVKMSALHKLITSIIVVGMGVCPIFKESAFAQSQAGKCGDEVCDEINFHQLTSGKNFGDILKLFNPVIDEADRKLYVVGSKTTYAGVIDLDNDELADVFDIGAPGGFLIFSDKTLYSYDFSIGRCYLIDPVQRKAAQVDKTICENLVPHDKGRPKKWGNYYFKETGYGAAGSSGFPVDWSQDLNGAYGVIEIYDSSNNKKGEIVHGPDALYFTIDYKTSKLYTTNTGDGSISVFDLNKLEDTNYCERNSCWIKDIDIGNSADEVIVDSSGTMYVRNRLGGSTIYKYNPLAEDFVVIDNEKNVSKNAAIWNDNWSGMALGMWPTDMELSKDEKRLYVLSHYGALIDVIDTATNKVINKIKFTMPLKPRTDSISAMVVDKRRDKIFCVWPELGVVEVADGISNKVIGTIDLTKYGFDKAANAGPGQINLAVDEKSGKLYVYFFGKLLVFNGDSLSKENETATAISRNGELLMRINSDKSRLYLSNKIFDLNTLNEIGSVQKGEKIAAFNNKNNAVYSSELMQSIPKFKRTLKIYEYVNDAYSKEWQIDGLGEIINTSFDFNNNVFYVADFLSGTVKKYSLSAGSVLSGPGTPSQDSGKTRSLSGETDCDLNRDGKIDGIEQQMCGKVKIQQSSGGRITTGKCGDGICGPIEKEKGVCPRDCK
ncbi:MAG: hypothetical protein AABZ65_01800 [Candidatus Omnitrophota bacterium]